MLKLLKYEMRGRKKAILLICIGLLIVNTFLLVSFKWEGLVSGSKGFSFSGDTEINPTSALAILVTGIFNTASLLIAFIFGIKNLLRDIFEDTGKLLFTLPKKGYSLVGAKVAAAIAEFLIYFCIILFYVSLHIMKIIQASSDSIHKEVFLINDLFYITFLFLVGYISVILLAYFSVTLCKSIFPSGRFKGILSLGAFITVFALVNGGKYLITAYLPYYVEFQSFALQKSSSASITQANISGLIYQLVIIAALYIGTSLMVEKRIELR